MLDEKALARAVKRAMENAGMLPAKEAVKLVPADWHRICDLVLNPQQALSPGSTGETEGWVLVPKEPTASMLAAGQKAWLADPCRKSSTRYRAMLSAAGGR